MNKEKIQLSILAAMCTKLSVIWCRSKNVHFWLALTFQVEVRCPCYVTCCVTRAVLDCLYVSCEQYQLHLGFLLEVTWLSLHFQLMERSLLCLGLRTEFYEYTPEGFFFVFVFCCLLGLGWQEYFHNWISASFTGF